ncbi:MAG TPA: heparinase II/III family protein [Kofleriaceae bacterium]|nr:heparinase II/III family protein [Kofleriaceae bacterium]
MFEDDAGTSRHGDAEKLDDGAALLADWVAQVLHAEPALDQTWKDHALALRTAFEIFGYGQELIVEPGPFTYVASDPFYAYQTSPSAQNVLVVDNDDTVSKKESASSRVLAHGAQGNTPWVQASHAHYGPLGVSLVRTFAFAKPDTFVVIDHLQSSARHQYAQHFHLHPDLEHLETPDDHTVIASRPGGPSLAIAAGFRPDRIEMPRGVAEGSVRRGWYFPSFLVKQPAYDVVTEGAADTIDLPVVIVLSAPGKAARIPADLAYREAGQLATLSWRLDGIEHTLSVPRH